MIIEVKEDAKWVIPDNKRDPKKKETGQNMALSFIIDELTIIVLPTIVLERKRAINWITPIGEIVEYINGKNKQIIIQNRIW